MSLSNGHNSTSCAPNCPKSDFNKIEPHNNVGPLASALKEFSANINEPYRETADQEEKSRSPGFANDDIGNNVVPFVRAIEKHGASTDEPDGRIGHQKCQFRIPSIMIDDTDTKTFVYAVTIGSVTPGDPTVEYKIRHGCSTLEAAKEFATGYTDTFIKRYYSMLQKDAANDALHVLAVDHDYPTPAIKEPGDPYLPPSYTGPRPDADTWAICKEHRSGAYEICVRYWKHDSHLRWIKTVQSKILGNWPDLDHEPRKVYLVQYGMEAYLTDDNVYPGQRAHVIGIIGAYWTYGEASQVCTLHVTTLGIRGIHTSQRPDGSYMIYEREGMRHTWCVKQYPWDEGKAAAARGLQIW